MTEPNNEKLIREVRALLAPGDIELNGVIVHTAYDGDEELSVDDETLEIGDIVADHAGVTDWYVYSGNDDPEFSSNQHQGLRLADDGFVWECQHLLRAGTFDIVMYYESAIDQDGLIDDLEAAGYDVTGVAATDP